MKCFIKKKTILISMTRGYFFNCMGNVNKKLSLKRKKRNMLNKTYLTTVRCWKCSKKATRSNIVFQRRRGRKKGVAMAGVERGNS